MIILMLLLWTAIIGYVWLTDSKRVRAMAGDYLSGLLGGKVEIGGAELSIFEGLRLDDVRVRVDNADHADSTIFQAQTFLLRYDPRQLLEGRLAVTQITAIDPTVTLVEDAKTQQWNYQRIWNGQLPTRQAGGGKPQALSLPVIVLRNGRVRYTQMLDGKAVSSGQYELEGQLSPLDQPGVYRMQLQTRGPSALGPSADITFDSLANHWWGKAANCDFGADVRAMMPQMIRDWCDRHGLQGRINLPEIDYSKSSPDQNAKFKVALQMSGVELAVSPVEWMSDDQNRRSQWLHHAVDLAQERHLLPPAIINKLLQWSTPSPVHLRQASGEFIFTDNGIQITGLSGNIEGNSIGIEGNIDGYSVGSAASIKVYSLPGQYLDIPAWSPAVIGTLPSQMRDVFDILQPQGTCTAWLHLDRPGNGQDVNVTGHVDVQDGQFCDIDFPYVLHHSHGSIIIGPVPGKTGSYVTVQNLIGHGADEGPNANANVIINGWVGPFDQDVGVDLQIAGAHIVSERALRQAFPVVANNILRMFDPDGRGEYPKFAANLLCHVTRAAGPNILPSIDINLDVTDAEGVFNAFPYPLKNAHGSLEIHVLEGYVKVIHWQMQHDGGAAELNGIAIWDPRSAKKLGQPVGVNLQVSAKNVPIDDALKGALPDEERSWLQRAGVTGRIDLDGTVFPATPVEAAQFKRDVDFDMNMQFRDGAIHSKDGEPMATDASATLHLTQSQLTATAIIAHRGDSILQGHGTVGLSTEPAQFTFSGSAVNLLLDPKLRALLPADAGQAWDSVRPQGTIDADISYDKSSGGKLEIRPRQLAVTPDFLPYRMELTGGAITITPDKVEMREIVGHHGNGAIKFSGSGDLGPKPQWQFPYISADPLNMDDELLSALPSGLSDFLKSMKLAGSFGMELTELSYHPEPGTGLANMDFASRFTSHGASMDVGITAQDVQGTLDMAATIRNGELFRMKAALESDKLTLAGRPASHLSATIEKTVSDPIVQLTSIRGTLADGDFAGHGQFNFPSDAPGKYDVHLDLHDADVPQLTGSVDKKLSGRLTASLDLEGNWNDPATRRGHGELHVTGKDMYKVPLVFGLMQITSLSTPTSFSDAMANYTIDGSRVDLDRIDLSGKNLFMPGHGQLDFATGKVDLWFTTDNPSLISLPIIGDLIQATGQQLLKIHVTGSIQHPQVATKSLDIFTTTIDQVFKSDDKK